MTDLFFPVEDETNGERLRREAAAKKICDECGVRSACLSAAMLRGERGVWGGTTEMERKRQERDAERVARRQLVARRAPSATTSHPPEWRLIESRPDNRGTMISLLIAEGGTSWHGFQWAVHRGDTLAFAVDNEPDAWLYFHSLVVA